MRVAREEGVVTSMRESRCLHSVCRRWKSSAQHWFPRKPHTKYIYDEWESLTSAQPTRVFDLPPLDLRMQRRHALIVEWHLSTHEDVEDDSEAPYIDLGTGVRLGIEELGGGKVKGTTEG